MLSDFLSENKEEILELAKTESDSLAGVRPTSEQIQMGLPIFFQQMVRIIEMEKIDWPELPIIFNRDREKAATDSDEVAMAKASGHNEDVELAKSAGHFGVELFRLGYTLSHVVHMYGSICQAITGLATKKSITITALEFRSLNRCLDVAIASAVTEFQSLRESQNRSEEIKRFGFSAHELRNSLGAAVMSFQMIKRGEVGFSGRVGQVLERSLMRMDELISRSLAEVKLMGDNSKLELQSNNLLLLVDQLLITANEEAKLRNQVVQIQIDPDLNFQADPEFFHSAISNLIQNALKYTRVGGTIQIRASVVDDDILVEIEDQCGGLAINAVEDLFKPFEQKNKNRNGLGLGLTLARKAIELHKGTVSASSLPGLGCVFAIRMPKNLS